MSPFVLLPSDGPAAPACSPATCPNLPATQYVCPDYWTSQNANGVWNGSTNRWDLYQAATSDHFWQITNTGWESGLRPSNIDFVLNLNENAFWQIDLVDTAGDYIINFVGSIGPGLVTQTLATSFGGPTAVDDIGNGQFDGVCGCNWALKLGTFGTLPAELVSICFRP